MRSLRITRLLVVCSVLVFSHTEAQFRSCRTPNGENARCISIHSCDILYNAVTTRNPDQIRFLKKSQCGYGNDPLVCCGSYDNFRTTQRPIEPSFLGDEPVRRTTQSRRPNPGGLNWDNSGERPNWNNPDRRGPGNNSGSRGGGSLPDKSSCGIQTGDRILDGQKTTLTEFPWMALLQYRKSSGNLVFSCGGSLISSRYILTAAHCVKGQILTKIGPLVNVRLGEYNTETEEDCNNNQLGFQMCNDKPFDSGIERVTAHADYNEASADRYNDIALIKMKREAPTTDFIRPICLPVKSEQVNVGQKLVVAGWGRTEYASSSPVKLKLQVPIVASSQCSARFRTAGVTLGSRQLCAGGERGRDSCNGDSGGPLMSSKNETGQWYIEGIVSFGATCGSAGWPGVYTRVTDYVDWIRGNVN